MTRRLWAVMLVVALLITALPFNMAFAGDMRMVRCDLRLRAKTSTESNTLVVIPGGTEVEVLGITGGWTKTSYKGHTGYISTNYLVDLTPSGYYPLKEGDNSIHVKTLQEQLIKLGYMTGPADGKYGKTTTEAVKAFQKENGIGADGLAGGETQRTLYGDLAKGNTGDAAGTGTTATDTGTTATDSTSTAKSSGTTLRMGSRGDDVKNLQARLIELGYLSGRADGIYGTGTEKAVRAFQKQSSLSVDGKAGNVTQNLLYSSSAKKADGSIAGGGATDTGTEAPTSYTTLKRGVTSNDVKKLQTRLKELGYLSASATGFYGTQTQAAIENFQKQHGLKADGVAGSETQTALYASTAQKWGSNPSTATGGSTTYATLKEGMKSSAVTTMQKRLRDLGYMTANATGYYGSATKVAVVAFQKKHGLTADGVAGSATLTKLYDDSASSAGSGTSTGGSGAGKISGPSSSSVKLLHWIKTIKPSLKNGSVLQVYDPATGYGWQLRAMSLGRHCDSEPITAQDTQYMNSAFGNQTTWTPKVVYIKLPSGTWTMATMHNTPHLSGGVKDNNFDGHLCVHFLRDMDEVTKNDPKYGVQNQKVLREGWKKLTGETVN